MIKIFFSHISPLQLSGWSITPVLCNIIRVHTHTHTCTEAGIITVMVTVMQEIKERSAYYSTAAGRQVVTARRERLLEHTCTHSLALTHIQTLGRWDMSPGCETFSFVISLSTRYTWMDCYGTAKDRKAAHFLIFSFANIDLLCVGVKQCEGVNWDPSCCRTGRITL